MDIAAFLPASLAFTTTSGPVTQSPPAKTPGNLVSSVIGSAVRVPHFVVSRPRRSPKAPTSGDWPIVTMTASHGRTNSEPGIASGAGRPLASGGPSFIFRHSRQATRPPAPALKDL